MANLLIINILPNRVADLYKQLKITTSKLHKSSSSIGFIKKALYNDVIPTFAKVKGHFTKDSDRLEHIKKSFKQALQPFKCFYQET